jgi:hypothetical protein
MNQTPFCEFCKSLDHDISSFRSLQMIQDNTRDAFWVEEEQNGCESSDNDRGVYQGGPRGGNGNSCK